MQVQFTPATAAAINQAACGIAFDLKLKSARTIASYTLDALEGEARAEIVALLNTRKVTEVVEAMLPLCAP